MEKLNCLVCNQEMESNNKIMYIDHFCNRVDDHHFSIRVKHDYTNLNLGLNPAIKTMAKLRIRFQNGKERLTLKVHYDEGYSEVWSKANSSRLKVNQIIVPDFSNLEKIKNKIRTILVFG